MYFLQLDTSENCKLPEISKCGIHPWIRTSDNFGPDKSRCQCINTYKLSFNKLQATETG